ncbi:MAG: hypothetical protein ACI8RA_002484, partial [Chlamydiales bacterium]
GKSQSPRASVSIPMRKLLTGEPYALIAHVCLGGRGGEIHPYPYQKDLVTFCVALSVLKTSKLIPS